MYLSKFGLYAFCASVEFVLDPPRFENGSESALGGDRLLMLSVHPLEAFRVLILLLFFFLDFDSEAFRASVGPFFGVWSLSFVYTESKIWPKNLSHFFGQI